MFKVVNEKLKEDRIIPMNEMEPGDIGIIVKESIDCSLYDREIVLRTASMRKFEVMRLSNMKPDLCWTYKDVTLRVKLLEKGERITLEVL